MDIKNVLQKVAHGAMDIEEAEKLLRENPADRPYEEMGFAKLDTDRKERSGFAEVVYCQGKSDAFIGKIFKKLYDTDGEVFGTRASHHQYELVKEVVPSITYDPISHILKSEKEKEHMGCIAVCTGGTADISVAEEAAQTAEYFGSHVERIYDVGVSGIHRLLSQEDRIRKEGQLRHCGGRYGRGIGLRHRRAGEKSGDCSAHVRGIRCQLSRPLCPPHHD